MPSFLAFSKRYVIQSALGTGGMGEVSHAWDKEQQHSVALKIIHADISSSPRMRRFFNREARAFSLLHHPNIVELFDYGMTETEQIYISMELVSGCSLHQLEGKRLPLCSIIDLTCQVLDALAYTHARGLVHRDLKPENVLITLRDGKLWAKLADFGLAALPSDDGNQSNAGFGTPAYMAPEQILVHDRLVGPCTDIYAAGILLFEALTGKLPFTGDTAHDTMKAQICNPVPNIDWLPHLEGLKPQIKSSLRDIVQTALSKNAWNRFISANAFKQALRSIDILKEPLDSDIQDIFQKQPDTSAVHRKFDPSSPSASSLGEKIRAVEAEEGSGLLWPPDRVQTRRNALLANDAFAAESFDTYNAPGSLFQTSFERFLTEFVRVKELSILSRDAELALSGKGCLRIVSGGFGLGKTKLIKCASQRCLAGKFYTITCASPLYHTVTHKRLTPEQTPANILRHILTQLQMICDLHADGDSPARDIVLEDELSHISAAPDYIPGDLIWKSACAAISERLDAAAHNTPIAILIDDLQRCSIHLYELLSNLQRKISSIQAVIFITFSPTEPATPPEISNLSQIPQFHSLFMRELKLETVPAHALRQMLKSCWRLDNTLSQKIASTSYGNPGYATALVQHLSQTSRLRKNDKDLFGLAPDDDLPLDVPKTITMHFRKKLDEIAFGMGPEFEFYREILIRMSAFGLHTTFDELNAFWKLDLDRALAEYGKKGIEAWVHLGMLTIKENEIQYTEPWMGQAALSEISARQMKSLKAQAAMALVDCYATPTPEQSWRVAQLWKDACDIVSFIQCGHESALHALTEGRHAFALEKYEILTKIIEPLFHDDNIPNEILRAIQWPEAFVQAAEAATYLDKSNVYDAYCSRIKKWVERTSEAVYLAHLQLLSARRYLRDDNYTRAIEVATHACESFEMCSATAEAMQAVSLLAEAEFKNGQTDEAENHFKEALNFFVSAQSKLDIADTQIKLAHIEWYAGHSPNARKLAASAVSLFESCRAQTDKLKAQFDSEFFEYMADPDEQKLHNISDIAEQFDAFDDPREKLYPQARLMLLFALNGDWKSVHNIGEKAPSRSPYVSCINGTFSCLCAIEQVLNSEQYETDNNITMAIASFGPRNRRARAWCHTLSGLHSALMNQREKSRLSFDRALNDFNATHDQVGILSAKLGLAMLASSAHNYEQAIECALECIEIADRQSLPIHTMLAAAVGIWAAVQNQQFDKTRSFAVTNTCVLPNLIKQYWTGFMNTTLDCIAGNPNAASAETIIRNLLHNMKASELQKNALLFPSVELSL